MEGALCRDRGSNRVLATLPCADHHIGLVAERASPIFGSCAGLGSGYHSTYLPSPIIADGLQAIRSWLNKLSVKTLFIEPGSPWENGYIESFNGKLRDELLSRDIFTTLTEAKVLIADWRKEYDQVRPHNSLGYKPPAPEAKMVVTLTLQVVQLLGSQV